MKSKTLRRRTAGAKVRLASHPHAMGVGWGAKIVDNHVTVGRCMTVFVAKKQPKHRLRPAHRIPKTITVSRQKLPTDVVELGSMRLEGFYLQNGNRRGTAGIYASRGDEMMAASCAHVVAGDDDIWTTADMVDYFDNAWKPLGPATGVQKDHGFGTPEEWGWFDGGLARIDDAGFLALLGALAIAQPFDHVAQADEISNLAGQPVFAMRANGSRLDAVVLNVMTDGLSDEFARHDLLIRHPEGIGLTRLGDSGMVWRLADGRPLAMHMGGYQQIGGVSTISACFFVQRLAQRFALQLLEST